ncbi:hypothetical protein D3C80_1670560 [compost metagenome]
MPDLARTGHPVGMSDRNGAAVHVAGFGVDAKLALAVQGLAGERLVEFPQVDVLDAQAVLPQQFGNGMYRADAHLLGRQPRHGHAPVDAQRRQALLLGGTAIHQDTGAGAIGQLARVARRDTAAFQHRGQTRQSIERGIGTIAFVLFEQHRLQA